jgi:hypothetical protein
LGEASPAGGLLEYVVLAGSYQVQFQESQPDQPSMPPTGVAPAGMKEGVAPIVVLVQVVMMELVAMVDVVVHAVMVMVHVSR